MRMKDKHRRTIVSQKEVLHRRCRWLIQPPLPLQVRPAFFRKWKRPVVPRGVDTCQIPSYTEVNW